MNPPPHSTTIKELFAGRRFEIPSYQRAYSWGEEQLSQFIEDLSESSNSHPYHLGHFLFERDEEKPDALYVIDGQQRLTTCIIFFSVASKVLERNDIAEHYLMTNGNVKFKTVPYDNDFFVDAIIEYKKNSKKGTKSQKNIYDARKYFERKLDKASDEEIRSWIEKLENASITTHVVGDKAEAAQIFAYQNDRGKDLTNLEVLKAYLMLQLFKSEGSEGDIACVEAIFADIYQNIVRISLHEDEVLDYYWQAAEDSAGYNTEDTVFEIKAWINKVKKEERPDKIKEFVKGLRTAFGLVEKIEKPNKFFDEETAYFVECLNRLGYMSLSYPLLIRAELFGVSSETKNFARLVKLLENLTFRYWVRGGRAVMETYLQDVISEEGANDAKSFNKMIDSIKWKLNNEWGYWSDGEIHECINSGYFYNSPVCNYLLWRYEHYLRNKLSWDDGIPNESIEHIAPQNPDNPLADGYGDYKARKKSEGIESGEWLHCVGNLTLLEKSQNSSLGNRPFKDKLDVYRESRLLQQKEIWKPIEEEEAFVSDPVNPVWDKAAIERRHNKILKAAMEIWDLEKI